MDESEQPSLGRNGEGDTVFREGMGCDTQAGVPAHSTASRTERQAPLDILHTPSGMADGDPLETHDHGCREAPQTLLCKPTLQQQSQEQG